MICHYCGFTKVSPQICPKCREFTLKPIGLGTEKIKEEIEALFPQSRVARADRDEIDSRKSLEDFLNKVGAGEIDIIVGTQMIAKGHDFPNLTLVGTLAADMGLHFPDFRSSERTFQLLTQVSGRAGRHTQPGRVVIQAFMPEHPAIQFAANHDYVGFATHALLERKELGYPPFGRLAVVRVQGQNLDKTQNAAQFLHEKLDELKNKIDPKIELMGPVEAALAKLKNKYRQQVLVKSSSGATLNKFLLTFAAQSDQWPLAGISVSVDMDAQHLL
jgi:primosomal protein N' (replication factor Y)